MSDQYSASLVSLVTRYFDDHNYRYQFDREKGVLTAQFNIENKFKGYTQIITFDKLTYTVFSFLKEKTEERWRSEVVEFLTRANYGLKFGCFGMDLSDGEIYIKASVDCDNRIPSNAVLQTSLDIGDKLLLDYGNALWSVMRGLASPEDACSAAENR